MRREMTVSGVRCRAPRNGLSWDRRRGVRIRRVQYGQVACGTIAPHEFNCVSSLFLGRETDNHGAATAGAIVPSCATGPRAISTHLHLLSRLGFMHKIWLGSVRALHRVCDPRIYNAAPCICHVSQRREALTRLRCSAQRESSPIRRSHAPQHQFSSAWIDFTQLVIAIVIALIGDGTLGVDVPIGTSRENAASYRGKKKLLHLHLNGLSPISCSPVFESLMMTVAPG